MKQIYKPNLIIVISLLLLTPFILIFSDHITGRNEGFPQDTNLKAEASNLRTLQSAHITSVFTLEPSNTTRSSSAFKTASAPTPTPKPKPTPNPTPTPKGKHNPSDYLIAIDAGHGGEDIGTQSSTFGYTVYEKDITLSIAKTLESMLKASKYNVIMVRADEENIDRRDRIKNANARKASLFISIHCDWFEDPSINGTTTYYSPINKNNLGKLTHYNFAKIIHAKIIENMETYNRGFREMSDFAVLRLAEMPSILLELGFMSNYSDLVKLTSKSVQENICKGIVAGIKEALDKT